MAKFFKNDKVRITSNPNKQTVYTVVRVSDQLYEVTYKGKFCLVHESEMEYAEKFQKTYSNVRDILSTLRKECEEFLMRVLTINAGQIDIDFDEDECEYVSVCYNGGAHPEYASNCYSTVRSIYIKNGNIYLDIEDADEYPISEITTNELAHVCDYIDKYIL